MVLNSPGFSVPCSPFWGGRTQVATHPPSQGSGCGATPGGLWGWEAARTLSLGQGSTWPRDSGFSGPNPGPAPRQLSLAVGRRLNPHSPGFPTCGLGTASLPLDAKGGQRKNGRGEGPEQSVLTSSGRPRTPSAAGVGDPSRRVGTSVSSDWRIGVLRPQAGPRAGVMGISQGGVLASGLD